MRTLDTGGSGTGVHHYINVAECPRRARHIKEEQETHQQQNTFKRDRGTILHKMLELYHTGREEEIIELEWEEHSRALKATRGYKEAGKCQIGANDVFNTYRKCVPPEGFGRVIDTELLVPNNDIHKEAIEAWLPGIPITAQFDMTVQIRPVHIDLIKKRTGLVVEPGDYLVDHKSMTSAPTNLAVDYMDSLQADLYLYLATLLWPNLNWKGLFINGLVCYVRETTRLEKGFPCCLVSMPNETRIEQIKQWLINVHKLAQTEICMINVCTNKYFGKCPYYYTCDKV